MRRVAAPERIPRPMLLLQATMAYLRVLSIFWLTKDTRLFKIEATFTVF